MVGFANLSALFTVAAGFTCLRAMMGYRCSRKLMSQALGKALVAIDLTQSPIYASRRSNGLLEGLLLIVISGLTNLARRIRVYQGHRLLL
jgi:hypothetical protein